MVVELYFYYELPLPMCILSFLKRVNQTNQDIYLVESIQVMSYE
jgi:hypothetical protein